MSAAFLKRELFGRAGVSIRLDGWMPPLLHVDGKFRSVAGMNLCLIESSFVCFGLDSADKSGDLEAEMKVLE